ncbi:MAG: trigger factor [Legionellales bacterium]|nr:trigger factor [Legionellales bacterium]|tara:strand:- start:5334 stop:6650 length:1317 start_codon:yes stop_codon:yes gene_type:complete
MTSLKQDGLKCELTVVIPTEEVNQARKERIKKVKKEIHLNGFRSNQVPDFIIEQRYGSRISKELFEELIANNIQDAFKKHNINPATSPKRENESLEIGKPLKVTLKFEKMPDIELKPFDQLKAKRLDPKIDKKDLETCVKDLLKQFPQWDVVKREIKKGDRVELEYTAKIGKDSYKSGEKMIKSGVIGEHQIGEALEKKLVGLMPGTQNQFTISFKKDFHDAEMAGKKVDFDVNIVKVEASKPSKLDESFIERISGSKKSVEEFDKELEASLLSQATNMSKQMALMDLEETIGKTYDFDLPETIILNELEARCSRLEEKKKEKILADGLKSKDPLLKAAQNSVRLGLIAAKVAQVENFAVSEKELTDYILSFGQHQQDVEGFFKWFVQDKERVYEARNRLLHQKALSFILDQLPVDEKKISFNELQKLAKERQDESKD